MHSETLHSVGKRVKSKKKHSKKHSGIIRPIEQVQKLIKDLVWFFNEQTLFEKTFAILLQFTNFSRIFYNLYSGYHKTCERSLLWYENILDWMKDSHFDFYFWRENLD